MKAPSSFNKFFLKHMFMGLRQVGVYTKSMSFQERKRAIKNSADASMALARGCSSWANALVNDLSRQEDKGLLKSIIGGRRERLTKTCKQPSLKMLWTKKILKRSVRAGSKMRRGLPSSILARRVHNKRTQLLKRLIPGGESLDGLSLLGEALDYATYLHAQVDIMQRIARAFEVSNLEFHKELLK